jgi:hypothetical protein
MACLNEGAGQRVQPDPRALLEVRRQELLDRRRRGRPARAAGLDEAPALRQLVGRLDPVARIRPQVCKLRRGSRRKIMNAKNDRGAERERWSGRGKRRLYVRLQPACVTLSPPSSTVGGPSPWPPLSPSTTAVPALPSPQRWCHFHTPLYFLDRELPRKYMQDGASMTSAPGA